jgi:hypothetical protein
MRNPPISPFLERGSLRIEGGIFTVSSFICPLLGAQELDSDEPSLCVHLPGKTVNKECP